MKNKAIKKVMVALVMLSLIVAVLSGCASEASELKDPNIAGYKIAVEISTPLEAAVKEIYPDAEIVYVNNATAGLLSVQAGKTDAYAGEQIFVESAIENGFTGVAIQGETFGKAADVAVGISPKTDVPNAKVLIDGFIEQIKSDGTFDEMYQRWVGEGNTVMPEIEKPQNPDKTITIATTGLLSPFTFMSGKELTGMDVEMMKRFALYANAELEIQIYDWEGLYSVASTDKIDYVMSHFYVSETGKEIMNFSIPLSKVEAVLVVADANRTGAGFFESISQSFERNFIRDSRWKLLVGGLGVTAKITFLSILFGTILGFIVCLGKRSKYKTLATALNTLTILLKGIPVLVILMLLYFVIFTKANGVLVSVIAFSLNLAAYSSDMMKSAIDGISVGQWEAASALGFEHRKTFWKIIVPQALRPFIPAYIGGVISLLHLSSVVGYVSVIDITYAVSLIRAQTYDAFLPLVTIAVVYLVLSYAITLIIKFLGNLVLKPRNPLHGINTKFVVKNTLQNVCDHKKDDNILIRINGLIKKYPNATPLNDLSCEVKRGEVISIIGPSGTGKSTLLRTINRLESPTSGSICVFDEEISHTKEKDLCKIRRRMGMVFQNFNLFPHMTVIENIMVAPIALLGISRQQAYEDGMSLLNAVGLADKALSYPDMMSGGQKQRVAIARALAMKPDIMLFDEPTSALDPKMVSEVLLVIQSLAKCGMTMMIVTHEMKFARNVSSKIFYMDKGIVYEQGTPKQIYENPETDLCRAFVNNYKVYKCTISSQHFDYLGEVSNIYDFVHKYYLSEAQALKMVQILEELCGVLLLTRGYRSEYEVDYDSDDGHCSAYIRYEGDSYNPLMDTDDIAVKLILSKTLSIYHTYLNNSNSIVIQF